MAEVFVPMATLLLGAMLTYVATNAQTRKQERRNRRVQYLLDAYRAMEAVSNRATGMSREEQQTLERAVADVYLLGNDEQQRAVEGAVKALAEGGSADVDGVLRSLRLELRRELGLSPGIDRPLRLRFDRHGRGH